MKKINLLNYVVIMQNRGNAVCKENVDNRRKVIVLYKSRYKSRCSREWNEIRIILTKQVVHY